MSDVAGGVRCREDVAQRRGYSDRSNAAHSTSLPPRPASKASSLPATRLALTLRGIVMLYVIHVYQHPPTNSCGRARHEWLFRLRFAQGHVAQLDLAPTLAAFASRSVISMPPRFARDYSACATLVISVGTHRVRTSDAERD
jgi:hypothetical protein